MTGDGSVSVHYSAADANTNDKPTHIGHGTLFSSSQEDPISCMLQIQSSASMKILGISTKSMAGSSPSCRQPGRITTCSGTGCRIIRIHGMPQCTEEKAKGVRPGNSWNRPYSYRMALASYGHGVNRNLGMTGRSRTE